MVAALPLFHSSKARRSSALISFADMIDHHQKIVFGQALTFAILSEA
jgi:hypothetical protein